MDRKTAIIFYENRKPDAKKRKIRKPQRTPKPKNPKSAVGHIPLHIRLRNILFWNIPEYRLLTERKNPDTAARKRSSTLDIFLAALGDEFLKKFSPTRNERAELIALWGIVTTQAKKCNFPTKTMKMLSHKCVFATCVSILLRKRFSEHTQSWATITWRKINISFIANVLRARQVTGLNYSWPLHAFLTMLRQSSVKLDSALWNGFFNR